MFSYLFEQLSPQRRGKVVHVGLILMIGLYAFFVLIAEPMHVFGAATSNSLLGGVSSSFAPHP